MSIRSNWTTYAWMSVAILACSSEEPTRPGPNGVSVPSTISQTIVENGDSVTASFNIQNTGDCPMSWSASVIPVSGGNWLAATPLSPPPAAPTIPLNGSQTINYTISVKQPALPAPLPPGLYQARIEIVATCTTTMLAAANSPAAVVFNLRVAPLDAVLTVGPDIEKDVVTLTSNNGVTGTWRKLITINDPSNDLARAKGTTAVWTGRQALLVGGSNIDNSVGTNAYAFNPLSLAAEPLQLGGLGGARSGHSAVWTGTEMIVWGGTDGNAALNTGYIYNPTTRQARATSSTSAPSARSNHQAVWTGTHMFVQGGTGTNLSPASLFNPASGSNGSWATQTTAEAPRASALYSASFWSGTRVILIAHEPTVPESVTYRFDPLLPFSAWSRGAPPVPLSTGTFVFTGLKLFGYPGNQLYDVLNDRWTAGQPVGAPPFNLTGALPLVAWTGSRFIVMMRDAAGTTAVYNPSGAGSWSPGPSGVLPHSGVEPPPNVWTGKQLLVFVGDDVWSFE